MMGRSVVEVADGAGDACDLRGLMVFVFTAGFDDEARRADDLRVAMVGCPRWMKAKRWETQLRMMLY
jgi:hypothetical protein